MARTQFEQSSQHADSLFLVQLNNARQLNDSLINQISSLQKITRNQLAITSSQLDVMQKSLKEQIISDRPKISVIGNAISDTGLVIDNLFSPEITTTLQNNGRRVADSLQFIPFIVDGTISNMRTTDEKLFKQPFLEPNNNASIKYKPHFPLSSKNEFYYCFQLIYYDKQIPKEIVQSYFYKYYKSRGEADFKGCTQSEVQNLRNFINTNLAKIGINKLRQDSFQ